MSFFGAGGAEGGGSGSSGSTFPGELPFGGSGIPGLSPSNGDHLQNNRISPIAFTVVTSVLYGVAVLAFLLRMYIRIFIQRHLYADDGFNILALVLLTISMGAFYRWRTEAFAIESFIDGDVSVVFKTDILTKGLEVRKWVTAAAIMLWTVINAAKFSFMFFFHRLITRLKWFTIYWWIVLVYLTAVWGWGISVFLAPCPRLTSLTNALQCISGSKADLAVKYSFAQVALDIFGDLLVLAIPVQLIWQVKIRWTQKIALTTSLCLSIAMVGTSAARATGILRNGYLDSLWVIFWYFNSANIALVLSSAAAFRTLYLTKQANRRRNNVRDPSSRGSSTRLSSLKARLVRLFAKVRPTPRNSDDVDSENEKWPGHPSPSDSQRHLTGETAREREADPKHKRTALRELPHPPRALMTGLRTFIGQNGRDSFIDNGSWSEAEHEEKM